VTQPCIKIAGNNTYLSNWRPYGLLTDQKVGGSSPSERAKHIRSSEPSPGGARTQVEHKKLVLD